MAVLDRAFVSAKQEKNQRAQPPQAAQPQPVNARVDMNSGSHSSV